MSLPDFMTDPNAVLNDKDHEWRYNRIPDYNKVNATYEEGMVWHKSNYCMTNIDLVSNLQKRPSLTPRVLLKISSPTWSR